MLYLKGRKQYQLQTTEALKVARKQSEQAIALEPECAQAYVVLRLGGIGEKHCQTTLKLQQFIMIKLVLTPKASN